MIKHFILTIWKASTDALAYVDDFADKRAGQGLTYLYALVTTATFLSFLPLAGMGAYFAPQLETLANEQLAIVQRWYPEELAVTLSGGVLSTNVDEPYALDLPPQWRDDSTDMPAHAVVIDTEASVEDFETLDTAVLLTRTAAVVRDDNGLRVFTFDEFEENLTIDKKLIDDVTTGLAAYTHVLPWIAWSLVALLVLVLPWIVGGVVWALELFFLAWATVVLWVVAKIMGRGLRYGDIFRLGLFGITSSFLLSLVDGVISPNLSWASWILFFGWMIYVISRFPRRAPVILPAPLPPAAAKAKADRPAAAIKKVAPAKKPAAKPRAKKA